MILRGFLWNLDIIVGGVKMLVEIGEWWTRKQEDIPLDKNGLGFGVLTSKNYKCSVWAGIVTANSIDW